MILVSVKMSVQSTGEKRQIVPAVIIPFFFFCLRFPSKVQRPLCLWWYCKKSRRRHSLPEFFFTMPSSHSMFWSVFPSELSNIATLASNPSSLLSIEIPTAWSEFILAAMTSERDVFCCFCERQVSLKIPNSLPDDNPWPFLKANFEKKEKKKQKNTVIAFAFICHYKLVLSRSQNSQRLKIKNSNVHKEIRLSEQKRGRFSKLPGDTFFLFRSYSQCWVLFNL